MEEPLLSSREESVHLHEVAPGLIVYEHQHEDRQGSHWLQTTSALLALQLGWGMWLMPANFAKLGWAAGAGCFVVLALLANYSGFLFCRLYRATPGAVLFGDIGFKAAGQLGRNLVYVTIYSLDATQCVLLHLAATQSLRHIFPADGMPPVWKAGALVVVIACSLVQIRSLAELSWLFTAGTACQLSTFVIILYELISNPDQNAKHSTQTFQLENFIPASIAVMSMIFAFGGQFAFIEIMSSMRRPSEFPKAVTACTILMSVLYALLGVIGYWSRGDAIKGMILFSLGNSPRIRVAAGLTLVQAFSQYMVNANVWTHNLLTLFTRSGSRGTEGDNDKATSGAVGSHVTCSSGHNRISWVLTSCFVVLYSYVISTSVPHFSTLVSLITSATFLISSYALPAWFTLSLIGGKLGFLERLAIWSLIPISLLFSGVGLYGSIMTLIQDVEEGEGW